MDDFTLSNLYLSRDEWCARLVTIFTPLVVDGIKSIFNEAWSMCVASEEPTKYLMTFQSLLCRVPKWNANIVEEERKRIIDRSGCGYLEDLITCVHIIQLKVLTCIRVGNKQKKIEVNIPKLDAFIHRVYINVARKLYTNIYLFERNCAPLLAQKNLRETEVIIQECIMTTIRESIPTESIIRAYMEEAVEQDEEIIVENIDEPEEEEKTEADKKAELDKVLESHREADTPLATTISDLNNEPVTMKLSFNDYDHVREIDGGPDKTVEASKSIERLERISNERALQRKIDEDADDDEGTGEQERLTFLPDDGEDLMSSLGLVDVSSGDKHQSQKEELSLDFNQL
jgi:hypothetical protein